MYEMRCMKYEDVHIAEYLFGLPLLSIAHFRQRLRELETVCVSVDDKWQLSAQPKAADHFPLWKGCKDFHYNPTFLVSDAAESIRGAFMQTFDAGPEDLLMCWAHKYEEFLKYLNKQWIVAHYGWFEGFKDSQLPSTNNSLPLDPVLRAIYVHGTNEHLIKVNELVNLKTNKEIGS
ncbi:hypothetical protein BLOT_009792 [Blomia tropicalis]|nr:hypothetical protein BLOT_009792 [Blomia tropicalis]